MKKVLTLIAALAMLFTVAVMPVSAAEANVEKPASIMPANFDVASDDFSNSNNQSLRNEWIWWLQDGMRGHHEIREVELADGSTGKTWWWAQEPCTGWARYYASTDLFEPDTEYVYSFYHKVASYDDASVGGLSGVVDWGGTTQGSFGFVAGPAIVGNSASKAGQGAMNGEGVWVLYYIRFKTTEDMVKYTPEQGAAIGGGFPEGRAEYIGFGRCFEATGGQTWAYGFNVCKAEDWDAWQAAVNPPSSSDAPDGNDPLDPDEDEPTSTVSFQMAGKPNSSQNDTNPSSDEEPKGLSTGAIVGIVAGAVVVLAGAAAAVYFLVIKKK